MATSWSFFDDGILAIGDGTDLSSTTAGRFKVALMQGPSGSSPYVPDALNQRFWADISANEIAAVDNGYTAGGASLTGIQLNETSGNVKWECTSPISWTQAGANPIGPFQYAVIYDTVNSDYLLCWTTLASEGTLTAGSVFSLIIPTTGILTLQEAP